MSRLAAVVLVAFAAVARADITVEVVGPPSCLKSGGIVAVSADDPARQVRAAVREGQTSYTLKLAGGASWHLRGEIRDCWSETRLVTPADRDVAIHVFPSATVKSTFAAGPQHPTELSATIARGQTIDPADCNLAYPEWTCAVPADVPFALRVEPPGFAALYYFDIRLGPGETRALERRELRPGASVAGWIRDSADKPLHGARVTLQPLIRVQSSTLPAAGPATISDERGFFQLTGLDAGEYLLVARAEHLSPATAVVRLRERQSLLWPQPIRAVPFAKLEVTLDPPLHGSDSPWTLELAEDSPLDPQKPPIRKAATRDGRWTADQLRATAYSLSVRNEAGSILEEVPVDLSSGGTTRLPVSVHVIAVRGTITAGDDPLSAELAFSNGGGTDVRAVSGDDGAFDAEFPSSGTWKPRVRFPRGSSTRIDAPAVEIARDTSSIEIRLPGGRVRGAVVTTNDEPARAAVHVLRNHKVVAQQVTSDDGKFDLVGVAEGDYTIDAAGKDGTTPAPVPLHLAADETRELKLVVEPSRLLRGSVLTPAGAPAIGSFVRVSTDGGTTWMSVRTDSTARFEYRAPRSTTEVALLVLSYTYPSTLLQVPLTGDDVVITLQPSGGYLDVGGSGAFIRNRFAAAPANAFYVNEGFAPVLDRIYLEPGSYTVCLGLVIDRSCREVAIHPGSEVHVDVGRREGR